MQIAVIQFDNRPRASLQAMNLLIERNRAYAERHGYAYRFVETADADLPVYWLKPHLCHQALQGGADIVMWLDTDAVVHDVDRPIEALFSGSEIMVGAGDNPLWDAPFNAGVFALRSHRAIALMDRWLALFAATAWKRTETAWVCEAEWAGVSYEQGAFNAHLLGPLLGSGDLALVDWSVLQSPFPVADAFTLHFAGPFKANLPAYLHTLGYRRAPRPAAAAA